MTPRLGVNIDHVATLRQARGESYPSVVEAAKVVLENGADQITIHLREDRRHIQDIDLEAVRLVTKKYGKPLNLEMGCNDEITDIAKATVPDWVCLVPENRQERTTEGGLNLLDETVFNKVKKTCEELKGSIEKVKISLFLESAPEILAKAGEIKDLVDAIEIHTGDYARDALFGNQIDEYLVSYSNAKEQLKSLGIACHAGHGLTQASLEPLLKAKLFEEYNIGHWIICQAVFDGLGNVVSRLKEDCTRLS